MVATARRDLTPLVLLPPSEGKAAGGQGAGWDPTSGAFRQLSRRRAEITAVLAEAGGGDEKLLGVGGDRLDRARSANASLFGAPTMPAWSRYTGVVWEHLDASTLSAAARRRIVVVSGLLGLVRADDPVPDHRLKMGASLEPLGTLSTWWRADITEQLARAARAKFVIDLLPNEHRAAWDPDGVAGVRIELVDPSGKPGGHFAKAAKGRLARAVLEGGVGVLDAWSDDRFELRVTELG